MQYVYFVVPCLLIMSLFINAEHKESYKQAVILKGLASLCFVVLGYFTSQLSSNAHFSKMVMIGLILGMIADILLNMRFVFDEKKGKLVFLVGILVFLSGHILYLCALLPDCKHLVVSIIIGIILTALLLKWIFSQITAAKAFKIFGIFYIGAIVMMNCVACSNLLTNMTSGTIMFMAGALFFLASDVVLILNTFGSESKFSLRITNLTLYYIGQVLIALSIHLF